ncbi:hypothetical protein [Lacticaseibacillus sp. GG6-2]
MAVITMDLAKALDGILKRVSPRLNVRYWPAYRDLRGQVTNATFAVWCSDPDDSEEEVLFATNSVLLTRGRHPDQLPLSEKRQAMARRAVVKFFADLPDDVYAPLVEAVDEETYAPLRLDRLTTDVVKARAQAMQARVSKQAQTQDFTALLDREALLTALMAHWQYDCRLPVHVPEVMLATHNLTGSLPFEAYPRLELDAFFDAHAVAKIRQQQFANASIPAGQLYLQTHVGEARLYLFHDHDAYRLIVVGAAAFADWLGVPEAAAEAGWQYTAQADGSFEVVAQDA